MFNIIQQLFNITFNILNRVFTTFTAKLTISTVPIITTIFLLLLFIIILISANRKRGYITTTINHVFNCHLLHLAKGFINTHVNILQTSFKTIDKMHLSSYNNNRTRNIFFSKSPFTNII